jgi:hypothetical protein
MSAVNPLRGSTKPRADQDHRDGGRDRGWLPSLLGAYQGEVAQRPVWGVCACSWAGVRRHRRVLGPPRSRDDRRFDLDPDLIAFFLLRRNLDDLVDWLGAVFGNDRPDEQRRGDLDGVAWCLSRWDGLEGRIAHARLVLARRRRRQGR